MGGAPSLREMIGELTPKQWSDARVCPTCSDDVADFRLTSGTPSDALGHMGCARGHQFLFRCDADGLRAVRPLNRAERRKFERFSDRGSIRKGREVLESTSAEHRKMRDDGIVRALGEPEYDGDGSGPMGF
jgi:hypothetical protein